MRCNRPNQILLIEEALQGISLEESQKNIIIFRFTSLLREYQYRSNCYSYSFNTLRVTITVGSLIVPAILSIQNTSNMSQIAYWVVWVISLFVTISNGVLTLLKIDKKYYVLNTTYQHLLSEGWQYIELSGKYSGFYTPSISPSHENQFMFFCNVLEKIRMRHIQDEYYKVEEHPHTTPDNIVPPSPLKALPFSSFTSQKSISLLNGSEGTATVRRQNTEKEGQSEIINVDD